MDNTQYLKDLADAEKRAKATELEQAKASALTAIEQEKAKTMPTFTTQKQQTNTASQVGAKNLAEFWAQRGQTNAGINAQAEMSNQNVLGRDIGAINKNEAQAVTDYSNQSLAVNTAYQNNLLNANNTIDQNLQTNLYNDKVAQQAAQAAAEKEAYQRQQDAIANKIALHNAYGKVSNQLPEGTTFAQNGKAYQVLNGKTVEMKYTVKSTTTDPLTGVKTTQYETPKQQKYNSQGYWLNNTATPIKVGTANYQPWFNQYDNKSYIIVKDVPISLDEQGITNAYNNKKITKAQLKTITTSLGI